MFLFKGILLIVFLIVAVVVVIAVIVLSVLWKGFRFMNRIKNGDDARTNRHNRDYTGYRQQQYGYRQQQNAQQNRSQSHQQEDRGQTQNRQNNQQYGNNRTTIVDMRDPRKSQRRIFDDQEGEYIDYTEE